MLIHGGILAITIGFTLEPSSKSEPAYLTRHLQALKNLPNFDSGRLEGLPGAVTQCSDVTLTLRPWHLRVVHAPATQDSLLASLAKTETTCLHDLPDTLLTYVLTLASRPEDKMLGACQRADLDQSLYSLRSWVRTCTDWRRVIRGALDPTGELMIAWWKNRDATQWELRSLLDPRRNIGVIELYRALRDMDSLASEIHMYLFPFCL